LGPGGLAGGSRISRRNSEVMRPSRRFPRYSSADVAILDILLSDGQCVDVAKKLRADGVPFIVHSALAPTEVDDAFRSGTFLVKPAGILDIVGAVTKLAAGDQRGTI